MSTYDPTVDAPRWYDSFDVPQLPRKADISIEPLSTEQSEIRVIDFTPFVKWALVLALVLSAASAYIGQWAI